MIPYATFADKAKNGGYIGIPYSTLDCQGFVKKVCRDLGENVEWIGSNDMWRNKVTDKRPLSTRSPTMGELLFIVKQDGKEPSYYTDGINASHVGIFCGDGVMESTTGGVQWHDGLPSKWTHAAKLYCIDYDTEKPTTDDYAAGYNKAIEEMIELLQEMRY